MPTRTYPEAELQKECIAWIRAKHPKLLCIYVNNNAASVNAGKLNKELGTVAGFPDVVIFAPSGKYHGLAVEFKRPGAKARPEQLAIHDRLTEKGYLVLVIHSFDTFKLMVTGYLGGGGE